MMRPSTPARRPGLLWATLLALLSVTLLPQLAATPAIAATTDGSLRIEPIAAYNFIVDSNVLSPSTYAPEAGTLAAKVCNTSATTTLTDVYVYIGDYNAAAPATSTPGVYPTRTNPTGLTGTYSLTHEGGSAGTSDASRYIPSLAPGACAMQYWLVSYPRTGTSSTTGTTVSVTGGIKPDDDLFLFYDMWATATEGAATRSVDVTRQVTMRNEISAAANKIWPNTTAKVPQEYLDAIAIALGWNTLTPSGGTVAYPGETVTTQGIWYDLGNVGFGFDNNNDGVPDQNAWLQPIGDPNGYDPGCFRLVRTYGILIVKLKDGGEQLIPFVDQLYFESIPENTGAVGLVYYQYAALDGSCTAGLSPYQEVASGYDNEKFSGDYGFGIPPLQSRDPAVTMTKAVNQTTIPAPPTVSTLVYTIGFQNTGPVAVGDPSLGIPLVISDAIPAGTDYVLNSATPVGTTLTAGVQVARIRYSTNNGATWTNTQPALASSVTNIQWWLSAPLPAGASFSLSFSVTAPVAPPTVGTIAVIPNTATASFGTAPPFAEASASTLVAGNNSVAGNVFRDNGAGGLFGNSIYDSASGETLLPNVIVRLYYDADGDGAIDSGEPVVASTAATYTGAYSFTGLADGNYIVQVDTSDADIPTGWTNTTRTLRTAALDPTSATTVAAAVSGLNFGFAPALVLDKNLISPTSPLYEGELVTFGLDVRNALPGSGAAATSCTYVIPASIAYQTTGQVPAGGGPTNAQWTSPNNALGLPDGSYAGTVMANNSDLLGLSGFNLGDQGGTITSVQYRITVRERVEMRTGDKMVIRVYYNDAQISTDTANSYAGNVTPFSTGSAGTTYTLNTTITGLRAWTWADFANNLTEMQVEGTSAGGFPSGELDLDSAAFIVTTNQTCGTDDTIISTVPLTDTFDTARLQFVSSTPPVDSTTPAGTLTWNNVGPLYPGQQKVVQATFRVLTPASQGQSTTNYAGTTNARFANGRQANSSYDNVPVTINFDGSIAGRVFKDANSNGWQGATGDDGADVGIPNVKVELFGCVNNATGTLYTVAGGTNPASTSQDCVGQENGAWQLFATATTDASGNYTFTGLRPGFYAVQVADGSAVLSGGTSTTTLPSGATQNAEASDSQTLNAGFTCPGNQANSCNGFWGNSSGNSGKLDTANFNAIDTTNESITNVDFGYTIAQAGLYGVVWHDYDADGVIDSNEPILSGVTVNRCTATPCSGANILGTATTDANGGYSFTNLAAGSYVISVVTNSGPLGTGTWVNTYDTSVPGATANNSESGAIALAANAYSGSYNFGYRQTGTLSIGDTLYYDWDADGTQDNGAIVEEGIRNVTVLLYLDVNADSTIDATNDRLVATTTTDANGTYSFANLPAGRYYVFVDRSDVDLPSTYPQTQDPDESGVCTTCNNRGLAILTATNITTQDFGYRPVGTANIGDTVWYDANGDGAQSGVQEVGIPNVTVNLQVDFNGDGTFVTVRTAVTDSNGNYLFSNLPNGTYRVVVDSSDADIPNDSFNVNYAPSTPTTRTITLTGTTNLTADFGFTALAAIGDTVYADVNKNGQQDYNEPGIAGVTVSLTNADAFTAPDGTFYAAGAYTAVKVTDASGKYLFSGLPAIPSAGSGVRYTVTVSAGVGTPIAGRAQTADPDRDGETCASTTYPSLPACNNATTQRLYPGSAFTGADFGYETTGVLGDTLWIDADADGYRDAGEYGIPYVTVNLRYCGPDNTCGNGDDTTTSTTTDANGEYLFSGLANGTHQVSVDTADTDLTKFTGQGLTATYEPGGAAPNNLITVTMAGGVISQVEGSATPAIGTSPVSNPNCGSPAGSCSLLADFGYRFVTAGGFTISGTVCQDTPTGSDGLCGAGANGVGAGEAAFPGETIWLYRWADDGDGVLESGEAVLAGVTTTATTANGAVQPGDYSFAGLPAATGNNRYLVSLAAPTSNLTLTTTGAAPALVSTSSNGYNVSAYRSFNLNANLTNQDFAYTSPLTYDFGDLPDTYSTTLQGTPDGARHTVSGTPTLYLGTGVDSESNGVPTGNATGDDLAGGADDENGVTLPTARWVAGANGGSVNVTVNGSGYLVAWIDFNKDGDFADANETIIDRAVSTGTANYSFTVPAGLFPGGVGPNVNLPARFRLFSSAPTISKLAYSGTATSGEVEDYNLVFTPDAVTLESFAAQAREGGPVTLSWRTASELNVAGFSILRSDSGARADARRVSGQIAALGDSVSGASYRWLDQTPAAEGTRYWLEVVNTDGTPEEYGPVAATPLANADPGTRLYLPLLGR